MQKNHVMGTSVGKASYYKLSREATMVLPTNVSALAAFLLLPNNAVDAFSTHHASVRILYVVDAPMS